MLDCVTLNRRYISFRLSARGVSQVHYKIINAGQNGCDDSRATIRGYAG